MLLPYSIPRRMLAIEKLNYRRHCCSAISTAITTLAFFMCALRQSGLCLTSPGMAMSNVWVVVDFVSLIGAATSLLCGLVLVLIVERRKSKLRRLIIEESKRMGFRSRIAEEQYRKSLLDKTSDLIEDSGHKVDLFGSVCNFLIQLVGVSALLSFGVRLNADYKIGPVGVGHAVDLISNSAFFLAIFLFTVSHAILHRKAEKKTKNVADISKLMALLLVGNLFVLGGKVILVLESVGILNPAPMPGVSGGEMPIGWAIRTMGMLMCALGLYVVMQSTGRKCDELSKVVERGDQGTEVMNTISTHEVRSCFGYLEYGTR